MNLTEKYKYWKERLDKEQELIVQGWGNMSWNPGNGVYMDHFYNLHYPKVTAH